MPSRRHSFGISFLSRDRSGAEMYLSLASDWDLDVAFLSAAKPYLQLKMDIKSSEDSKNCPSPPSSCRRVKERCHMTPEETQPWGLLSCLTRVNLIFTVCFKSRLTCVHVWLAGVCLWGCPWKTNIHLFHHTHASFFPQSYISCYLYPVCVRISESLPGLFQFLDVKDPVKPHC